MASNEILRTVVYVLAAFGGLKIIWKLIRGLIRFREFIESTKFSVRWVSVKFSYLERLIAKFDHWDTNGDVRSLEKRIEKLERRFQVLGTVKLTLNSESYSYRDQPWYKRAKEEWGVVDSGYEKLENKPQ